MRAEKKMSGTHTIIGQNYIEHECKRAMTASLHVYTVFVYKIATCFFFIREADNFILFIISPPPSSPTLAPSALPSPLSP